MTHALKFVEGSTDRIEGLAIPFGGPINGRDLDGEYFDRSTDFCLDWFGESGRPILYDHGLHGTVKTSVIGRQTSLAIKDDGLWVQAEIDKNGRYRDAVAQLIEAEALSFSSGAMGHLVGKASDGHITRWPFVELSATPTAANPNAHIYMVKSLVAIEHAQAVDADITPMVKALVAALDTTSDDSGPEPFDDQVARVASDLDRLHGRIETRMEQRAGKSGRVLSAANRDRIASLIAAWEPTLADLKALLSETDPEQRAMVDEAVARAYRTWAAAALI